MKTLGEALKSLDVDSIYFKNGWPERIDSGYFALEEPVTTKKRFGGLFYQVETESIKIIKVDGYNDSYTFLVE